MPRALLLLLGLLGAALASPTSGPQECAKGSAVWCRDLQAATRCGAVGHCQSAVWSKPTAKTLPCDVCLDVAAAASSGLNPDTTGTDILALVMKTCEWLPSQESSAKCKGMVDTHPSAVLSMLGGAPGSTPAQVCAALTLCQPLQGHPATPGLLSEKDVSDVVAPVMANGPLSFYPPQIPESVVCQDCVQLVTQLQDVVGSNLSSLAEVTTQEQCESLGPGLALLCNNYLRQIFAPAEQTLRLVPPQETCRKGGFCEALKEPARLAHVAAVDGIPSLEPVSPRKKSVVQMKASLTCEVCLEVVQELDQWLESNSTETMISHALERVCSTTPASLVQQCVTLVDTYSPSLVQLVARVTPEKVCKAIRLCGSRRRARAVHEALATMPSPLLGKENQGSICDGCKRLLGVSAHNLEREITKRKILTAFRGGCSILPLSFLMQCRRLINEYEPLLVESLMEMMDPVALCTKMGACQAPRTPLLGTDQCVRGPSFWCKSPEAAEMCGAVEHCQRHVWKETPFRVGEQA
ncbi:proactivator polypeptide-like 1 [Diceros bicornis minor]|uniref:proactivator polypeptide-like 1 n=1 Tax=Diceros bicornis minor TaxID=77932 RepID=UPI0026F135FE|nr:proactivator polypeptide-like 1 [Diceros bicornis minor]